MPAKQLSVNLQSWAVDGAKSGLGKKTKLTIKTLDSLVEDMKFIYSDNIAEGEIFFKRAAEMGYGAFIRITPDSGFRDRTCPGKNKHLHHLQRD